MFKNNITCIYLYGILSANDKKDVNSKQHRIHVLIHITETSQCAIGNFRQCLFHFRVPVAILLCVTWYTLRGLRSVIMVTDEA